MPPSRFPFDRKQLKNYPTQPGVYFMKGRQGQILYIGKAKNLRTRLKSYFQKPSALPPKVFALMTQVTAIETEITGSELEALLLEARLIKQHQPFYNRMVKHFQHLLFLKVSLGEPAPRVEVSLEMDDPEAVYYGPFSSRADLEMRIDAINRAFALRSCDAQTYARHHLSPCTHYQIGMCAGPCAGETQEKAYQGNVQDFLDYMDGKPCHTVDLLTSKREAYAEALLFERAAVVNDLLESLDEFRQKHWERLQAVEAHHCIIVLPAIEPDAYRLLVVLHGLPREWRTFSMKQPDWDSLKQWLCTWRAEKSKLVTSIPKELYEEARLISRWLRQNPPQGGWVVHFGEKSLNALMSELQCVLLAGESGWHPDETPELGWDECLLEKETVEMG